MGMGRVRVTIHKHYDVEESTGDNSNRLKEEHVQLLGLRERLDTMQSGNKMSSKDSLDKSCRITL